MAALPLLALLSLSWALAKPRTARASRRGPTAPAASPWPDWLQPDADEDSLSPFGPPPPLAVPRPESAAPDRSQAVKNSNLLRLFLIQNKTPQAWGVDGHSSLNVANYQKAMHIAVTGSLDAATRAAARSVGVELPPLSALRSAAQAPAPTPAQPTASPSKQAAHLLRLYLIQNKNSIAAFGTAAQPSRAVQTFQAAAGITADGIIGPQTRAAANALGVELPPRPGQAVQTASPAPAQKPTVSTPTQAAHVLRMYLVQHRTSVAAFGTKQQPSRAVQDFQRHAGITADGIAGPQTYAAAQSLGVPLPPRPGSAPTTPAHTPAPTPAPTPDAPPTELRRAANLLRLFLIQNKTAAAFGVRGHPSPAVQNFQRAAGITADGIVGPQTYQAAQRIGVPLPSRPVPSATQYQSQMTPGQRKAQEALKVALKKAANILRYYLITAGVQKSNPAVFGARGAPSKPVADFQRTAKITADGIVGPQTREVARSVGVPLPPKPAAKAPPPKANAMSLQQAANVLKYYLGTNRSNPAAWGYKGRPSQPVANFQRQAGIAQDGIYGPNTRAAGKRAGVDMPARPSN